MASIIDRRSAVSSGPSALRWPGRQDAARGSLIAAGIAIMLVTIQVPLTHTEFSSSAVHVLIHRLLASVCVGMQSM